MSAKSRVGRLVARARVAFADRRVVWRVSLLAMVLMIPTLFVGLQVDDWVHRLILLRDPRYPELLRPRLLLFSAVDDTPGRTRWLIDHGFFGGWWTDPDLRLNLFRPVSAATHILDYTLWPNSPFLMHVQSVLWLGAVSVAGGFLYRRVLASTWVGGLATVMYALDSAHGVSGAWIAQRNTLVSTCFGLLTLLAHDRWRRDRIASFAAVAPLLLAIALLAGEGAVATMGYLFAYAVCLDRGTIAARLRTLLPSLLVFAGWAFAYKHYGFGTRGSGMYLDPVAQPARFLEAALTRAPLLLSGELGGPPPDPYPFLPPHLATVLLVIALVVVAFAINALSSLVRTRAESRFFAIGGGLAVLPLCGVTPSMRVLAFASFGLLGLVAQLVAAVLDGDAWLPSGGPRRWALVGYASIAGFAHLVVSPLLIPTTGLQMGVVAQTLDRLADGIPEDAAITNQRLIIVNPPDASFSGFVPVMKLLRGKPAPPRTLVLCAGTSALDLVRTDARTLVVRPIGGFLNNPMDALTRDPRAPWQLGAKVVLTDVTIEVTALTDDQRPAEATFRFDEPLESSTLRWTKQVAGRLVPFALPAIGAVVHLDAQPLLPL